MITGRGQKELLLTQLPAIYQEQAQLAAFLRPFEALLLGQSSPPAGEQPSLHESILSLPALINPVQTPEGFLPWLASWLGMSLRGDLPPDRKRKLIERASFLYAWRGTRRGLEELLAIVTGGGKPTITEPEVLGLTVGVRAVIGATTRLGRDLPHFFEVVLEFPGAAVAAEKQAALEQLIRETIDLGKPAHTYYSLIVNFAETPPITHKAPSHQHQGRTVSDAHPQP